MKALTTGIGGRISAGVILVLICVALAGSGVASAQVSGSEASGRDFVEGRLLVKLEGDATSADLAALNRRNDARTEEDLPRSDLNVVDLPADLPVGEAAALYEASPDVEYAEPDFLLFPAENVPDDPSYDEQYSLDNTGQTGGTFDADIDAPEAWDVSTGDPATVVAVIDTGVDITHPDLSDNVWTNPDEIPGNGVDDDQNGYKDDVHGWDFFHNDATVYDKADGDEHGTHVSGTIAAEGNNDLGVAGVNWRASIMPLKFLGPKGGATSDAVKAINYAVANGAVISNNSWGGGGDSRALKEAIDAADDAGHLFVTAAGNGGPDKVGDDDDTKPQYPASYASSNIISVAATDDEDALAEFSNFGDRSVDLGAPGVSILSTLPDGEYGLFSGTSMATPHVTGVAALVKSQTPGLDDEQIKDRILSSVDEKGSLSGKTVSGGRLNAAAALSGVDNTGEGEPTITADSPAPDSKTKDRTPKIQATVLGDGVSGGDIHLYLDGKRKTGFSYDGETGLVDYTAPRLSFGRHAVKVTVDKPAGGTVVEEWSFRVIRR